MNTILRCFNIIIKCFYLSFSQHHPHVVSFYWHFLGHQFRELNTHPHHSCLSLRLRSCHRSWRSRLSSYWDVLCIQAAKRESHPNVRLLVEMARLWATFPLSDGWHKRWAEHRNARSFDRSNAKEKHRWLLRENGFGASGVRAAPMRSTKGLLPRWLRPEPFFPYLLAFAGDISPREKMCKSLGLCPTSFHQLRWGQLMSIASNYTLTF